jgi:hypothetical protein
MDLRTATYLTIALLPNHEKTSVGLSLSAPVRTPFRRCPSRGSRPPGAPILCPLPVLPTLLERARLRNEVTEGRPDVGLNRGFRKFLMTVSRPVAIRLSSAKVDKIKHAPLSIPRSALTFRGHISEQILPLDQLFHTGRPTGVLNRRFAKFFMGAEGPRHSDVRHSGEA